MNSVTDDQKTDEQEVTISIDSALLSTRKQCPCRQRSSPFTSTSSMACTSTSQVALHATSPPDPWQVTRPARVCFPAKAGPGVCHQSCYVDVTGSAAAHQNCLAAAGPATGHQKDLASNAAYRADHQNCFAATAGTVVGLWDSYVATAGVAVGPLNFLNCWTETFFIV